MNDTKTDVMSEAFGRQIVARTTFEKESLWLPLLAVHSLNAGQTAITAKTFTDCIIEGPAIVVALGTTTFQDCLMGAVEDVNSMLFSPRGPRLVGAIGLKDCSFIRCRFIQIGYTGSEPYLADMAAQVAILPRDGR